MEFVYAPIVDRSSKSGGESTRIPIDSSPPATNTRCATSQKEKAKAVDKDKSKVPDEGKGKVFEPEKPVFIPL